MKFLKILLGVVTVLAAVFFLGAYLLPERVRVERSIDIERAPVAVFAIVNDMSRFNEWSPWHGIDPDATYRLEGPATGPGATLHWQGNQDVGVGTMRIVSSEAAARVELTVAFEGFTEPANSAYVIEPLPDDASRITWTFETALHGPMARWFGLLMPGYIGADYDKGLARLKSLVESLPAQDFGDLGVSEEEIAAVDVIAIAGSAPADDMAAVSAVLGELFGQLVAFAAERDLEIAGQPLTLTDELQGDVWRFEAALPIAADAAVRPVAPVTVKRTPAGRALVVEHVGPYATLADTLDRLDAYALAHGHRRDGAIQEIYVSDPADTPPDALVTRIVYPITIQ